MAGRPDRGDHPCLWPAVISLRLAVEGLGLRLRPSCSHPLFSGGKTEAQAVEETVQGVSLMPGDEEGAGNSCILTVCSDFYMLSHVISA